MDEIAYWLPLVWAALLGVGVAMYVLLDGFDLGIGILFLTSAGEEERDAMMNSIAPYWDGNETWLVLGGAGLLVAFPMAYAVIMPALYLPLIVMLLALVFRGVAFEFRFVSKPGHRWWDWSFALGSTLATFCQGVVLGGYVGGIAVADGQFSGGSLDWLRPFPIFCGAGLIAGYALLGSGWLMMKTHGDVAERARRHAKAALILTSSRFVSSLRSAYGRRSLRSASLSAGSARTGFSIYGPCPFSPPPWPLARGSEWARDRVRKSSFRRWGSFFSASLGLAFLRFPISSRQTSPSGKPPPFLSRRFSASSALCCFCRSFLPIRRSCIGPSAARSPTAITRKNIDLYGRAHGHVKMKELISL
jgi:cytochrome bd-type quinol oxidase subunit 2